MLESAMELAPSCIVLAMSSYVFSEQRFFLDFY